MLVDTRRLIARNEQPEPSGFALGAASHVAALFIPAFAIAIGSTSPFWRHALFAVIDGSLSWAALVRPPLPVPALLLLLAQQLSTHGHRAWRVWTAAGKMDWYSIGLIAFLGYATATVFADVVQERGGRIPAPDSETL